MGMLIVVRRGAAASFYEGLNEGPRRGAKFGEMMKRESDTCGMIGVYIEGVYEAEYRVGGVQDCRVVRRLFVEDEKA